VLAHITWPEALPNEVGFSNLGIINNRHVQATGAAKAYQGMVKGCEGIYHLTAVPSGTNDDNVNGATKPRAWLSEGDRLL